MVVILVWILKFMYLTVRQYAEPKVGFGVLDLHWNWRRFNSLTTNMQTTNFHLQIFKNVKTKLLSY